jgi:hypothetical protein
MTGTRQIISVVSCIFNTLYVSVKFITLRNKIQELFESLLYILIAIVLEYSFMMK